MTKEIPPIMEEPKSFATKYKWAEDFAVHQALINWKAKDFDMEDDMQAFRTGLHKSEKLLVSETQRTFLHAERYLGTKIWGEWFPKRFPRPEFQAMFSEFACMESAVHFIFYRQMIDALHLNTEEFFSAPFDDAVLSKSLSFIIEASQSDDTLRAIAAFSFLEGCCLFTAIAVLMSFNKPKGMNQLVNTASGLAHSANDEDLHARASSAMFVQTKEEMGLTKEEEAQLEIDVRRMRDEVVAHEHLVMDRLFSFGGTRSTTIEETKAFADSRGDEVLKMLGYSTVTSEKPNPIADWFYLGFASYGVNDFFVQSGKDYEFTVDKKRFVW